MSGWSTKWKTCRYVKLLYNGDPNSGLVQFLMLVFSWNREFEFRTFLIRDHLNTNLLKQDYYCFPNSSMLFDYWPVITTWLFRRIVWFSDTIWNLNKKARISNNKIRLYPFIINNLFLNTNMKWSRLDLKFEKQTSFQMVPPFEIISHL